jgi:hypothetical protein
VHFARHGRMIAAEEKKWKNFSKRERRGERWKWRSPG